MRVITCEDLCSAVVIEIQDDMEARVVEKLMLKIFPDDIEPAAPDCQDMFNFPKSNSRKEKTDRNIKILEMGKAGKTLREIGEVFGIHCARVGQICKKAKK